MDAISRAGVFAFEPRDAGWVGCLEQVIGRKSQRRLWNEGAICMETRGERYQLWLRSHPIQWTDT